MRQRTEPVKLGHYPATRGMTRGGGGVIRSAPHPAFVLAEFQNPKEI